MGCAGMLRSVLNHVLLVLLLLPSVKAVAHIPVPSFMMERLARQRTKLGYRRLKVTMRCREGEAAGQVQVLFLKVPGLVRRERPAGAVEICRMGKCWMTGADEKPRRLPAWSFLPYLYFVEFDVKGSRYLDLLRSLKVNTSVDTIARFHSQTAVVYGAKQWERDRPQFWLDKDDFLPFRLMVRDGKSLVDILWIGWGSKTGGDWFPSVLEVRRDQKVVERCEVTQVETGVSMPEKLFQLD
jgi:hypothetical protein